MQQTDTDGQVTIRIGFLRRASPETLAARRSSNGDGPGRGRSRAGSLLFAQPNPFAQLVGVRPSRQGEASQRCAWLQAGVDQSQLACRVETALAADTNACHPQGAKRSGHSRSWIASASLGLRTQSWTGLLESVGFSAALALNLASAYAEVRDEDRRSCRTDYRLG